MIVLGVVEPRTDSLCLGYPAPDERVCARDQRPRHTVLSSFLRGVYRYEPATLYRVGA